MTILYEQLIASGTRTIQDEMFVAEDVLNTGEVEQV